MSYNLYTTTDYLLEQIRLALGGGGGGTVTTISGVLPIVLDNSVPAFPVVSLQSLRDTRATINGMVLADGEFYTITDMPAPLTSATFRAKFNIALGTVKLEQSGTGTDGTFNFNVGYNITTNEIFFLEHQPLNQIASVIGGSGSNCITQMQWGNVNWKNNLFASSTITGDATQNQISGVEMQKSSLIEFVGTTNSVLNGILNESGSVHFKDSSSLSNFEIESFASVDSSLHGTNTISGFRLGYGSTMTLGNSTVTVLSTYIGDGSTFNVDIDCNSFTLGNGSTVTTNGFLLFDTKIGDAFTIVLQDHLVLSEVMDGYSTASTTIQASTNFAGVLLTLPAGFEYFGLITLSDNAGADIQEIGGGVPTQFNWKVNCGDGIINTFIPVSVLGVAINGIVSPFPDSLAVRGRVNGGDFVEFVREGNYNVVVNPVIII